MKKLIFSLVLFFFCQLAYSQMTKADCERILKDLDRDKYRLLDIYGSQIDKTVDSPWADTSMGTEDIEFEFGETMLVIKDTEFGDTIYIPYQKIQFIQTIPRKKLVLSAVKIYLVD